MLQAKTVYSRKVDALRLHTQMLPTRNGYAARAKWHCYMAWQENNERITGEYYGCY